LRTLLNAVTKPAKYRVFKNSRNPRLTWNLCFLDASFQQDCGLRDPRT
jgi:hypothetical protein